MSSNNRKWMKMNKTNKMKTSSLLQKMKCFEEINPKRMLKVTKRKTKI